MNRWPSRAAILAALTALAPVFALACGDGGVGDLLPGSATGATTPHSADGGIESDTARARALFDSLLPELDAQCGGTCHTDGNANAPMWLAPPDRYRSIRANKLIVVKDWPTSKLLTIGAHTGPELKEPLRGKAAAWLAAESGLISASELPSTEAVSVAPGPNSLDLSRVGVAGARLSFQATVSGTVLTLHDLRLVAPATTGVHATFPVFVIVRPNAAPIEDTSFSNSDQSVPEGQAATLLPGTLILTQWAADAKLRVAFTKLEAAKVPVDAGAGGGCKSVATFTAQAVPAILANQCLNCHQTGSAQAALDLSALGATPKDDAQACAQALTKINRAMPARSAILQAPRGQITHPFAGASVQYVTDMTTWIQAEQ